MNWRGQIPICDYSINEDTNPEIINKVIFNLFSNKIINYI